MCKNQIPKLLNLRSQCNHLSNHVTFMGVSTAMSTSLRRQSSKLLGITILCPSTFPQIFTSYGRLQSLHTTLASVCKNETLDTSMQVHPVKQNIVFTWYLNCVTTSILQPDSQRCRRSWGMIHRTSITPCSQVTFDPEFPSTTCMRNQWPDPATAAKPDEQSNHTIQIKSLP